MSPAIVFSQNLVPNPSFEDTAFCPPGFSQIQFGVAPPWYDPTGASSDYYHQCNGGIVGVPNNSFGYQFAYTGSAYCGFLVYSGGTNTREYVSVQLLDTLIIGKNYCVEMQVSLANVSSHAIDAIGMYFSTDSVYKVPFSTNLPYVPQVINTPGNFLADTANWMVITSMLFADSAYRFITIGNFKDDANTDTFRIQAPGSGAYYYVDDVSVIPMPTVYLGKDTTLCPGDSLVLDAGSVDSIFSYSWSTGDTTQMITITTSDTVWVEITNGNCSVSDTIVVTFADPTVNLGNDTIVCNVDSVVLDAGNAGSTYQWSTGDTTQTITVSSSDTVWVEITKGLCKVSDTIIVFFANPSTINLGNDTTLCNGETIQLDAGTGWISFLWSTTDTSQSIVVSNGGNYWVVVTDSNGCQASDTVQIGYYSNNVNITASPGTEINEGESVYLSVTGGNFSAINWTPSTTLDDPNSANPTATPTQTTTYYVTVTDDNGCTYMDTITVVVKGLCDESGIFIPNTFTPNGDGVNDFLYIKGEGIIKINYFRVYSRWGELVFETSDINKGWDGTFRGKKLNTGVFVYVAEIVCRDGETIIKHGDVTLLK